MPRATNERVVALVRERGVLRPRDLTALGLDPKYLSRLERIGRLERVGRGLYVSPEAAVHEHHTLAEVAKRAPHGVVCLLSALRFHEIGTQNPYHVALHRSQRLTTERAGVAAPHRALLREAMRAGVEEHAIEGATVRVYNPAKTVATASASEQDRPDVALRHCARWWSGGQRWMSHGMPIDRAAT
jgi:predicted transcriptional regulator of viral defense system